MTEQKNKDGVPLRIGQRWANNPTSDKQCELTIVDIGQKYVWCVDDGEVGYVNTIADAPRYFYRLLECPVLGDMSEWRVVTAEEKREHPVPPQEAKYWDDGDNEWSVLNVWTDNIWWVPRAYEWPVKQVEGASVPQRSCDDCQHADMEPWDEPCSDCGAHSLWAPKQEPAEACEFCAGTGHYGDNGAGIKGNSEYHECDECDAFATAHTLVDTDGTVIRAHCDPRFPKQEPSVETKIDNLKVIECNCVLCDQFVPDQFQGVPKDAFEKRGEQTQPQEPAEAEAPAIEPLERCSKEITVHSNLPLMAELLRLKQSEIITRLNWLVNDMRKGGE